MKFLFYYVDIFNVKILESVGKVLIVYDEMDVVVFIDEVCFVFEVWDNVSLFIVNGYGYYWFMKNFDFICEVVDFIYGSF